MPQLSEQEGPDANNLSDKAMMDLMWNELSCRIYRFLEGQSLDQFISLHQTGEKEEGGTPALSSVITGGSSAVA